MYAKRRRRSEKGFNGPRYLLDTNICIYIRRRRPREDLTQFLQLRTGEAALSVVTYGELVYGMVKLHAAPSRQSVEQLDEFVSLIGVMPLPVDAGRKYGEIRSILETKGEIIGGNDLWIAANALSADLILVTNNEREFRRVPDLKIENWTK
jgi:tRNA(fMet)-specific endonuclease VapC